MRTVLTAIAGMMLAGTLYGQEVDVCGQVYAPWGSSAADVIRAGTKAQLTFKEVTRPSDDGVVQVTFINGSTVRVFTLLHGKYVSFSLLVLDKSEAVRSAFTARQMQMVMARQADLNDDGAWVVTCGDSTVKATMETEDGKATFRVISMTALKELVNARN